MFLGKAQLKFAEQYKYLGHIIQNELTDNSDIQRQMYTFTVCKSLYVIIKVFSL